MPPNVSATLAGSIAESPATTPHAEWQQPSGTHPILCSPGEAGKHIRTNRVRETSIKGGKRESLCPDGPVRGADVSCLPCGMYKEVGTCSPVVSSGVISTSTLKHVMKNKQNKTKKQT